METNFIATGVKTAIKDVRLIDIPKIEDRRGNLSVIEGNVVPFDINRVYYLYDVPSDGYRGGHAHRELKQLLIALSGSFEVVLRDGHSQKIITLNKPNIGLLIVPGIWRELQNFSSGSVCLVLASDMFDEGDYLRNYTDFIAFKSRE